MVVCICLDVVYCFGFKFLVLLWCCVWVGWFVLIVGLFGVVLFALVCFDLFGLGVLSWSWVYFVLRYTNWFVDLGMVCLDCFGLGCINIVVWLLGVDCFWFSLADDFILLCLLWACLFWIGDVACGIVASWIGCCEFGYSGLAALIGCLDFAVFMFWVIFSVFLGVLWVRILELFASSYCCLLFVLGLNLLVILMVIYVTSHLV